MAVSEQYFTTCMIGERGCGKTTFALGDERAGVKSMIMEHAQRWNMKVLFLDNWRDRPGYGKISVLSFADLKAGGFKRGAARVIVDRSTRVEVAGVIYQSVRNTVICVEDSRMIVPQNISDSPWEDLLMSGKNIKCSLVFMYHGFSGIPPKMYTYIDALEIFKTKNHPQCRKTDILRYDEALRTYEKILADPNPYAHETVKNGS